MKGRVIATALLAAVVAGGVAACSLALHGAIDPVDPPAPASFDSASVMRGAQLAAIGNCISCHTTANGSPYAGGMPLETPFGTVYSTNVTPEPATGIGRWSLAAFERAMRQGVSRDGHLLYPAFPYPHYTHLTGRDIRDLYAFMMTRTPVHAPPRDNALAFPLGFRPLISGWNLFFLHPGPLPGDASHDPQWLRGRYLVEGPGHCAACHTPLNMLGAERGDRAFAGAQIEGWDAPPLNRLAQGPRAWTVDQMTDYLRTGLASQHGAAAGPMEPVTRQLSRVPESDVRAMVVYLLATGENTSHAAGEAGSAGNGTAAPRPQGEKASGVAADPQRLALGKSIFESTCAACHAVSAPMRSIGQRPALERSYTVNADSPRNAINLLLQGIPLRGAAASHYMPSYAGTLNDAQVAAVLAYVRSSVARRSPWMSLDQAVAKIRKEHSPK